MRAVFLVVFLVLVGLSIVVYRMQPPPSDSGKVRLVWVSDDNPLRAGQADLFNKLHPDVHVVLDPANNGTEKVIVQSIAGVGPDLFDCGDSFQLSAYVKSGIALDISDMLREKGINIKDDTFKGTWGRTIYGDSVYGVPTNIAADGLWYHKDLLEAAGVTLPKGPWTWKQFIPIAEKLTKRDKNGRVVQYGLLMDWWNWAHFFAGFGAKVYSDDGRTCILDHPQAIAAVQMMYDLVYKYQVSTTPAAEAAMATEGGFGSGTITFFLAKRGAMAIGSRWWLSRLREQPDLRLGVAESPYGTVHQFNAYGRSTLINRASPHVKEALEFLLFEAGPQYNNLINDQADSIPAFKKYAQGQSFLHDPKHPLETYNGVWRQIAENSDSQAPSPYVNGQTAYRIIQAQLDLVQANQKSPRDAMVDAARLINEQIRKNVADDPVLQAMYDSSKPGGTR